MAAVAIAALVLLAWLATLAALAITQAGAADDRMELRERAAAKVSSAENRASQDLKAVATELEQRQQFIEKMVDAHLGELPSEAADSERVDKAAQPANKVTAALPQASPLARLEARQLALVELLTDYAERRAAKASEAMRKLGLNPRVMAAAADDKRAQGGPLLALANGKLDARFERLGAALARMSALERGFAAVPQVLPASMDFISSGFGYRSDPFTGGSAFHAGLDFTGPIGAPIYAAAKGRISFAGVKQGYGNCIEIDHGNGLTTRYAHLSAFRARHGDSVAAGQEIAGIGNTGRSTGPHLHFEVRMNDQAVNPRPFLQAAAARG